MPTKTTQIPLTTLPLGDSIFGPVNANHNATSVGITSDRTVPGGMNSLTSDSTIAVAIETSSDGVNWKFEDGATWAGGIITGRNGQLNTDYLTAQGIDQPASSQMRVRATVAGPSPIAVQGTITVSS